jgi:uncharacterized membrane protein YeaQ/YmgE (transglycosylase-associated protein family)
VIEAILTSALTIGGIIGVVVVGLIVGALGRLVVPGRQPMGLLATSFVGIAGSVLGEIVGRLLFGPTYLPGLLMSVAGAAVIVLGLSAGRRRI